MKSINNKIFLILILIIFGIPKLYALSTDAEQPINIVSDNQSMDLNTDTITFDTNVVVRQGSIKITANKLIIQRDRTQKNKEVINAYGNPLTFYQELDNGQHIDGSSQKLHYDASTEYLTLIDEAKLQQGENDIQADKIVYDIKSQQIKASSNKNSRVKTKLIPQSK